MTINEIKNELDELKWKMEKLTNQQKELEQLFNAWKYAYSIVETDYKRIKENLKNY